MKKDKNNKNLKIGEIVLLTIIFCLNVFIIKAFSLMVEQDPIGIYCIKDNGLKAINEWVEIDFEGDNYLEYYYFNENGYLIMNGVTPDGYMVNERGQWIQNGVVQRKKYEAYIPNQKVNEINNNKQKQEKRNVSNSYLVAIVTILLFIVIISKAKGTNKPQYKNKNVNNNYYNSGQEKIDKQKIHHKNTTIDNDTTIKRSIFWHFRLDTDKKGEEGEDEVAEVLKSIGEEFIVLRNINLPRTNKKPVQIDFLCISNKGIFVIEVKSWLGKITGDYEDDIWHSQINYSFNDQKNPIKQNEWHIDVLKRFIKQNMTYYSIIVFTDRSDISWIDKEQNKTYITNVNYLNSKIYSIYESSGVKSYSNYKSVAGYLRRFVV